MPEKLNEIADHTLKPEDVMNAEKLYLKLNEKKCSGLAISGGGIRSASFGLGVMQALVNNNQLSKIDFMSTVSGGGYLGSALTWALKQGEGKAGTTTENFPLGKRGKHTEKETVLDDNQKEVSGGNQKEEDDNKLLDFIRQHGSYLAPTSKLDMVSFVAVIIRSMVMSLVAYFSLLTVALAASLWLLYKLTNAVWGSIPLSVRQNEIFTWITERGTHGSPDQLSKGAMIFIGLVILIIILLKGFWYSLKTYLRNKKATELRYKKFNQGQESIGLLLKLSLTCFVFGSLPYFISLMGDVSTYLIPSGTTLFGTVVGMWQYKKAHSKEKNKGIKSDILIYAGAIALFYGILLFAYLVTTKLILSADLKMYNPVLFFALIAVSIIFGWFVNLNLIGPHHIWRNRLMEAFMPNKNAVETNCWEDSTEADSALMEDMCDENNPRPYHIINTNVILSNSPQIDYRGRGGDNFIISRLYCGSDATGCKPTTEFQKNKNTRGITLATAMATSAAALNPNAGVSGEGMTRNVVVSILLSMLNLRLGYWTSNPGKKNTLFPPNFFFPGLTQEILRNGLSERDRYIQLSDGGHYENLGLYELIRRELDLIIVSDGGADPDFNFDDLANAVEKVRVDFGTKITFIKGYKIEDILPGTGGNSQYQTKYEIAKHGFAIADITYAGNERPTGKLVYLKLAMIEDMSTDVFSYKGLNPDFPHQSTSDQFFDEKQFEAYRELGYYVAWQMMESKLGKKIFQN